MKKNHVFCKQFSQVQKIKIHMYIMKDTDKHLKSQSSKTTENYHIHERNRNDCFLQEWAPTYCLYWLHFIIRLLRISASALQYD